MALSRFARYLHIISRFQSEEASCFYEDFVEMAHNINSFRAYRPVQLQQSCTCGGLPAAQSNHFWKSPGFG
jgi:hypothetical protein